MHATAADAESAFYEAFSRADVEAMMAVWAPCSTIACIHPSGPRLEGRRDIRHSWTLIFNDRVPCKFELRAKLTSGTDDFQIHVLEENISIPGTTFVAPAVLATNAFQRFPDGGWYLVLHHASIAPGPTSARASKRPAAVNKSRLH
jgi:ketosteroid isomerase-like protein